MGNDSSVPLWALIGAGVFAVVATICGPLLLPVDMGTNLAMAGCAAAGWLGIHTAIPKALAGRPQLASMWALVSGGLAAKMVLYVAELPKGWPQAGAWFAAAVLGFLSGKPLEPGASAITACPPGSQSVPEVRKVMPSANNVR